MSLASRFGRPHAGPVPVLRTLSSLSVLCAFLLAGCGGGSDGGTAPVAVAPPAAVNPDPAAPPPVVTEPTTPNPLLSAQAGDVLKVAIQDLHPTQPSVGYDQIYYHLGRKQPDLTRFTATPAGYLGDDASDNYSRYLYRTERKRVDDYCADNGQGGVDDARYVPMTVRLIDPKTFACKDAVPTAGSTAAQGLKTVVVGRGGTLYLTDGHHTMTALNELADGGAALPVWVRVAANFSSAGSDSAFWDQMKANQYTWLFDAQQRPITPEQLPAKVGLATMQDDPYRSLVYFTRGLGYDNGNVSEFAEFYWASWLRKNGFDLAAYTRTDLARARIEITAGKAVPRASDSMTSYVAAARDAALRMVALAGTDPVDGGRTAADLGKLAPPTAAATWNDAMEEEIWRTDLNTSARYRSAGKAWYAKRYRQCGGAASTAPACWLQSE